MRYHGALSAIVTLSVLVLARPATAASINDFLTYSLLDSNNNPLLRGLLHVPAEYATDPTTPRPLILFFHGSGESGTNNLSQINGNIDNLLAAAKVGAGPFFMLHKPISAGTYYALIVRYDHDRPAIADRDVDLNRIYVTGLSMGGGGVWNFLNQFPDRVAAAVPIFAAGPSSSFLPANVVNEPIWAFHGRSDANVPVTVTRNVINSLLTRSRSVHPHLSGYQQYLRPGCPIRLPAA